MFVEDGTAALKELKSGKYDAALLDLRMPIMNGGDVMLAFREYERASSRVPLPVFALTADVSKEAIEQSLACGFTKHLSKPIRKATLLEEIARVRPPNSSAATKTDVLLEEGLSAVTSRYLNNVRRQASLVAATLAAGDFNAIVLLGHNMRGTGSMIGLPRISQIGEQLEQEAREQNAGAVNQLADELIRFLDSTSIQHM
jgi:CheY-like chemotaxis protein